MDFFAEQDKSRGKTTQLIVMFLLAVAAIILSVYTVIIFVFFHLQNKAGSKLPSYNFSWFNPELILIVSIITIVVIAIGSLYKIIALGKGGGYVAESLGGKLVNPSTSDPDKRKLINVVEEMSIAAGMPVPQIYVLDNEEGINAFAAGYTPNDAAIAVTRGCIKRLNRDELQGVVAHEFSHIFNGDMRLNIRLIGLLSGILIIANIGYILLRTGGHSRKSGGQLALAGLGFLIIGYAGVFIGRLIQSSISRQREYLADASAVQFTRNPAGIGNALKKIGGFSAGSQIMSPGASEACHMFIASAISSLFATHPPIVDRIQRIDPSFKGDLKEMEALAAQAIPDVSGPQAVSKGFAGGSGGQIAIDPKRVVNMPGNVTPENISYGSEILAAIPVTIRKELDDIYGAVAVVCALLLDKDPDEKENQLNQLGQTAAKDMITHIKTLDRHIKDLDPRMRLPLPDLAVPSLRMMSMDQYTALKNYIRVLIEADKKITIFEFAFDEVLHHRLDAAFDDTAQKVVYKNINALIPDAILLLSTLAIAGQSDKEDAKNAFNAALDYLPAKKDKKMIPADKVSFKSLHNVLNRFAHASPGVKKTIFDACVHCALFDKTVSIQEAELLRAIAYSMDIPVPPFIANA